MSHKEPKEWLQWICDSQDIGTLSNNYDKWAAEYEDDVNAVWQPVPTQAAKMLAHHLDNPHSLILDIGAGTGLTGVELHTLGFRKLAGIDISSAMLAKAAEKNVYQTLTCCAISEIDFTAIGSPLGMVATGVFADNHAGPQDLAMLADAIADGGVFVFTVRQSFLAEIQAVVTQSHWSALESLVLPIYEDPIHLLAYKIQHT